MQCYELSGDDELLSFLGDALEFGGTAALRRSHSNIRSGEVKPCSSLRDSFRSFSLAASSCDWLDPVATIVDDTLSFCIVKVGPTIDSPPAVTVSGAISATT